MTIHKLSNSRLNALKLAFRVGENAEDLSKVDAKYHGVDETKWHVALDGATLLGQADTFFKHFVNAYSDSGSEVMAERLAFELTSAGR